MNVPESFWKWVAAILMAFIMGAGGNILLNGEGEAAEAVQKEMDKRSDYQSRVHMAIQNDVEDLDKTQREIEKSLARIEALLELTLQQHHQ